MDLNKLRTFVEVAKTQSITQTADKLFRTQSAITKQIQQLEDDLEMVLLDRRNARIYLTKEGEALFEETEPLLQQLDDRVIQIKKDASLIEGTLKVGALIGVCYRILPAVISQFQAKFPKVRFEISQSSAQQIEKELVENRIDFAIHMFLKDRILFESHPIFEDQVVLIGSQHYLQKVGMPTVPDDLLEMDLIEHTRACGGLYAWLNLAARDLLPLLKRKRPYLVVEDPILIRDVLLQGCGIGVVPHFLVEKELISGELIHLFPEMAPSYRVELEVAIKRKRSFNLAQESFLQHLIENSKHSGVAAL